MSANQQSVLLTEPKEVDIVEIERGLSQLWKQASETRDGDASFAVMRACSLNFIVVTNNLQEASALADVVGRVSTEYPGRIFVVTVDHTSEKSSLEAWISARCSLVGVLSGTVPCGMVCPETCVDAFRQTGTDPRRCVSRTTAV
jgi:sulfite exporter TauE/SafE